MKHAAMAATALRHLPIGAQIVAADVEADGTARALMFEHRLSVLGNEYWANMTVTTDPAQLSEDIARDFDDMVVTHLPGTPQTHDDPLDGNPYDMDAAEIAGTNEPTPTGDDQ